MRSLTAIVALACAFVACRRPPQPTATSGRIERAYERWLSGGGAGVAAPTLWQLEVPADAAAAEALLSDPLAHSAVSLTKRDVTAIIARPDGYYLLEIVERIERVRKPITAVRDDIMVELKKYPALRLFYRAHRELSEKGGLATTNRMLVLAKWAKRRGLDKQPAFTIVDGIVRRLVLARQQCIANLSPAAIAACKAQPPIPEPAVAEALAGNEVELSGAKWDDATAIVAKSKDGTKTWTVGDVRTFRDLYKALAADPPMPGLLRPLSPEESTDERIVRYAVAVDTLASAAERNKLHQTQENTKSLFIIHERLLGQYIATTTPADQVPPPDDDMVARYYEQHWDKYIEQPLRVRVVWTKSNDRAALERFLNEFVLRAVD